MKILISAGLYLAISMPFLILGIAFLQSGLDKVFNYSGNLEWLKGHFKSSPLSVMVPGLLILLTFLECGAGIFSLANVLAFPFFSNTQIPGYLFGLAIIFNNASLLALFFGQRMAKDYPGAASLVNYVVLSFFSVLFVALIFGIKPNIMGF
jgi:hypothetical protein